MRSSEEGEREVGCVFELRIQRRVVARRKVSERRAVFELRIREMRVEGPVGSRAEDPDRID